MMAEAIPQISATGYPPNPVLELFEIFPLALVMTSIANILVIVRVSVGCVVALTGTALLVLLLTKFREARRSNFFSCIATVALGLVFAFGGTFELAPKSIKADAGAFRDYVAGLQSAQNVEQLHQLDETFPAAASEYLNLVQYRVRIRHQLRTIYDLVHEVPLPVNKDASMKCLAEHLSIENQISADWATDIRRYADDTHFAEWSDSWIPDNDELSLARNIAPALIGHLNERTGQLRTARFSNQPRLIPETGHRNECIAK